MSGSTDIGPFSIMPRWLRQACRDDLRAQALYACLADHADRNSDNGWTMGRVDLADELGWSTSSVDRAVKHLVAIGALEVQHNHKPDSNEWSWSRYLIRTARPEGLVTGEDTSHHPRVEVSSPVRTGLVTGDDVSNNPSTRTPLHTSAHSANERGGAGAFDEFWKLYPRKSGKRTAETAFARAVTRAKGPQPLMDGLAKRMAWWQRAHTPMDKIPHPATWLNGDRWLDQLEPTPATAAASMAQRAADVEAKVLDEAQQAIERGDRRTALKILRERARQQNQWAADHILQWIDVRSDSAIVASADETQRCTLEQVQEIRDYLVKLGMSHGGAEWNGSRQIGAAP